MLDLELTENASTIPRTFKSRVILGESQTPKIISLILKSKIVKDETQAGYILFGLIMLIFIAAIGVYVISKPTPAVPYEESPHMKYGA